MTGFSNSPKLLKAGIVLIDPESAQVKRIIALQYNPDSLTRSFQAQAFASESGGERSEALRLKGPAVESYKLDAEIDAADQLEFPEQHAATVEHGIQPQLAALELLLYPSSDQLNANNSRANAGTLEIVPMETPLALFVWSKTRIVPVGSEGAIRVHVELLHDDPGLTLPLVVADEPEDAAADWQAWGRALNLPLLVVEQDGTVRAPLTRLGGLTVASPSPRRRRRFLAGRRPRFLRRRKVGQARPIEMVAGREIIARN